MDWLSGVQAGAPWRSSEAVTMWRVGAVGLHHVEERLRVLADGECDVASVGGDGGATEDLRCFAAPEFCAVAVGELPDALAGTGGGDVEEVAGTEAGGEASAGGERDRLVWSWSKILR